MFVALSVLKILALLALITGLCLKIRRNRWNPNHKSSNRKAVMFMHWVAILGWGMATTTMFLNGYQHTALVELGGWIGISAGLVLIYILGD
jgi:hypothetical protein